MSMDDPLDNANRPDVNDASAEFERLRAGITLEAYAEHLGVPRETLERLGLTTITNPWIEEQTALAIPYRRRDGTPFRLRIRQSLSGADSKRTRSLWDRRQEKLGGLLYGLDQLPAKGCPILLVDDEALCHVLWHHGFDAVAVAGAAGYFPKRDDAELDGFPVTVLAPPPAQAERRVVLLQRLVRSKHRNTIKIAELEGDADLLTMHRQDCSGFVQMLKAALATAAPLLEVVRPSEEHNGAASGERPAERDGTIADKLVSLAQRDGMFFAASDGSTWADVWTGGRRETWSLRSRGFKNWLVHLYYATTGRAPNSDALSQALLTLDASARYDGERHPVRVRTGMHDGKYYLDLADEQWQAVEIDTEGWRVISEPPIRFQRPRGMLPLPVPVQGGSLGELKTLLNLARDDDLVLMIAWLLSALRPVGPYPLLALAGEPGAAKSTTARVLRMLTDPNVSCLRSSPREERDCWIAAGNAGMLTFDNLSSIPGWLSDVLCRIATGGGYATRQLHTDDDEILFDAVRPILLTSVSDVIARSDLADRAILIELPRIPEERRRPEEEFNAAFEDARPRLLGALLDAMVTGLRRCGAVTLARLPRLADFAVWATACEPAFTHEGGVMEAYERNRRETVNSVIEGDAVCVALFKFMESQPEQQGRREWKGRPEALLEHLCAHAAPGASRSGWPANAQTLSGRLRMAAKVLAECGVQVDRKRNGCGRSLHVAWTPAVSPRCDDAEDDDNL
jgi:hypothetical protein